jgi:alpha-N-arabinofuranosidase
LSLHYYTVPSGNWGRKGSATEFNEEVWFSTLRRTLEMDKLIQHHEALMNEVDPQKKVGLVVDEWGTWYNVEPGTNPGFLYQQNTLRDALVAGLNFHIFHRHADRVAMANIAQTVNVLQAVILTDKEKMLRTPTYWVFEMFKVHQGATTLKVDLVSPDYEFSNQKIPAVSASATRRPGGPVSLSLVNTDPQHAVTLSCTLAGFTPKSVNGRVLTASEMNAHNTFAQPDAIRPVNFTGAKLDGHALHVELPSKAVVILELN